VEEEFVLLADRGEERGRVAPGGRKLGLESERISARSSPRSRVRRVSAPITPKRKRAISSP
jgi:hypothetical protein